jgi:ABC-type microcin C transport system permease subunit YejB
MKRFLLIVPFLFTINSNAKLLHAIGGGAVGYAVGRIGSNGNVTNTANGSNIVFRCFCSESEIEVVSYKGEVGCVLFSKKGKRLKTDKILFFQIDNAPNIIVEPLKTKMDTINGCEVINN